ncbi:MAG TPA: aminoacyl-tRNA hydrolase [Candidatus Krumholzibacteria bacterium]|nr:aminoacyl-tRNA hydrolase [Candidatus Krumholzibacteria bacterium]
MDTPAPGPGPVADGDRVVFGLGNPGSRYRHTRHNLGFMLLDRLEADLGWKPSAGRGDYLLSQGDLGDHRLVLVRPTTFMNRSGLAVTQVLEREGLERPGILVAVDDVAIDRGRLRVRRSGAHAGHNGLRSIHERLGSGAYARLRLGCGPPPEDEDLADYVLSEFDDGEWDDVESMLGRAAEAVRSWVVDGVEATMSRFNG